jgi:hypothetical protein
VIRQTGSEGRVYFEKKLAEGKTKKDAIRSFEAPDLQHRLPATRRQPAITAREDKRERLIACVTGSVP